MEFEGAGSLCGREGGVRRWHELTTTQGLRYFPNPHWTFVEEGVKPPRSPRRFYCTSLLLWSPQYYPVDRGGFLLPLIELSGVV